MKPKISIVVPVYNVEPYLTKCMESLCNQTLKDIEIIAVNDCSTDDSLTTLNEFGEKDSRIKIINHEHNELTAKTRNDGLKIASGEYIGFVDGDDYIDLDFYEKLYNLAKSTNSDIAKGITKILNEDGTITIANDNENINKNGKYEFWGHLFTAIYKRSLLQKYNIKFHIDFFCFQIQAVYYANKIVCSDDTFYNYIRHNDSCDSKVFSLEKWQRLNLGHANFIYDFVASHQYNDEVKKSYLKKVKDLYFYGYNRLIKKDVLQGSLILAHTISTKYDCGFNTKNMKRLRRKLYRKNKSTTIIDYLLYLFKEKKD